ncbi:septal ring lytic transglycosylase [Arcobacter acticola]|uniref:Probable endolytic peptidoglycan transglycosylase RlpA n=1 Tax=Arcobacter acticola TaxID=1849015 RepID=A0A6M8EET1_9BACT|nr:septal ring lytic transglycosylase RlpA family protein [Arcobacter acticola]QKE28502.1 septal ring lytic transglycosylase [Arcobacter acticola]
MRFINRNFKNSILLSLLLSLLFFTGCSQKSGDVDYSFYKDTKNSKINNSKEMHKYTMRPYSVFGITYYPFVAKIGDDFDGIASWYGPDFHSKKTSNGEIYDMYDMTAAHKTLPMNTVVKVENLENGKTIIVRINDRGPFVKGRIIDLSNKAAHEIDMVRRGTAKVKVSVLGYNGEIDNRNAPTIEIPSTQVASNNIGKEIEPGIDTLEPLEIKEDNIKTTSVPVSASRSDISTTSSAKITRPSNTSSSASFSSGNYNLQVGAFSLESGAIKVKSDYQKKFRKNKVEVQKVFVNGKTLNKVFVRGFSSYENAQEFKNANGLDNAVISND